MDWPLRGGKDKGLATKKKKLFLKLEKKKSSKNVNTKLKGGGSKGHYFFAASLTILN